MTWLIWGVLLLVQNASFTWVSRARNSRSLVYHGVASIFSNGVWFLSLGVAVNKVTEAQRSGSVALWAGTAAFYTLCTVTGAVVAHHVLMTRLETGARKVG